MSTAARFMFAAENTFIEGLASSCNRAANCHCDESSSALSGAGIFACNLPTWTGLPSRPRGAEPFGLPEELSPVIRSCSHSAIRKPDAKVSKYFYGYEDLQAIRGALTQLTGGAKAIVLVRTLRDANRNFGAVFPAMASAGP
jgi:hypothetical protein